MQWPHWFRGQIRSQRSKTGDQNLDGCEDETNCEHIIGSKEKGLHMIALVMEDGETLQTAVQKQPSAREEKPL